MKINSSQSTGQIVVEVREAAAVFEKLGINYYTKGTESLEAACDAANITLQKVNLEFEGIEPLPLKEYAEEPDWHRETMATLIYYIVLVHHVKTRLELNEAEKVLAELSKGQDEQSELGVVRAIFLKMSAEFRNHLREEEEVVFPYLIGFERALQKGKVIDETFEISNGFSNPFRDLLFEHGMMDKEFKEIVKLIYHFNKLNGDLFRPLSESLGRLEKDNQKHIQLENNILLKRAAQLGLLS